MFFTLHPILTLAATEVAINFIQCEKFTALVGIKTPNFCLVRGKEALKAIF